MYMGKDARKALKPECISARMLGSSGEMVFSMKSSRTHLAMSHPRKAQAP